MKKYLFKFSIIFALMLLMTMLSGCGSEGVFDKDGADEVFAILSGIEVYSDDDDFIRLINIDGQTFDSLDGLSFEVEDPSVVSITGTYGVIKANEVEEDTSTNVKVSYGDSSTTIKVVVIKDTKLADYYDYANVVIPYGVQRLSNSLKGSDIEFLRIPSTVIYYAEKAFDNCTKLKEVDINSSSFHFSDGCFKNCTSLESVSIPEGVNSLDDNLFRECSSLKNIEIPSSVEEIGAFCFFSDYSIEDISIPDTVTYICERAFENCSSLKSINLPSGIETISDDTFASCSALESVTFPEKLTYIGERAFLKCTGLTELIFPNTFTDAGLDAFANCIGIKTISIPVSYNPTESAFNGVSKLEKIILTNSGKCTSYTTDTYTFTPWYSSRTNQGLSIEIEEGVSNLGDYLFVYCSGIREITLPSTIRKIGRGVFRKCYNIQTVNLSEELTDIGIHSFSLCYKLENLEFPSNLTTIGAYAFYCCNSITDVTLPDSVTRISTGAFSGCNKIQNIQIGETSNSNLKTVGMNTFAGLMFNCSKVSITSKKLETIMDGAFGYYSNDHGLIKLAQLADGATISIASESVKSHFRSNVNYCEDKTSIQIN